MSNEWGATDSGLLVLSNDFDESSKYVVETSVVKVST